MSLTEGSGAETPEEAELLTRRPKSGPQIEAMLASVAALLAPFAAVGIMTEAELALVTEETLDIAWLWDQGHISRDEMDRRAERIAERSVERFLARQS